MKFLILWTLLCLTLLAVSVYSEPHGWRSSKKGISSQRGRKSYTHRDNTDRYHRGHGGSHQHFGGRSKVERQHGHYEHHGSASHSGVGGSRYGESRSHSHGELFGGHRPGGLFSGHATSYRTSRRGSGRRHGSGRKRYGQRSEIVKASGGFIPSLSTYGSSSRRHYGSRAFRQPFSIVKAVGGFIPSLSTSSGGSGAYRRSGGRSYRRPTTIVKAVGGYVPSLSTDTSRGFTYRQDRRQFKQPFTSHGSFGGVGQVEGGHHKKSSSHFEQPIKIDSHHHFASQPEYNDGHISQQTKFTSASGVQQNFQGAHVQPQGYQESHFSVGQFQTPSQLSIDFSRGGHSDRYSGKPQEPQVLEVTRQEHLSSGDVIQPSISSGTFENIGEYLPPKKEIQTTFSDHGSHIQDTFDFSGGSAGLSSVGISPQHTPFGGNTAHIESPDNEQSVISGSNAYESDHSSHFGQSSQLGATSVDKFDGIGDYLPPRKETQPTFLAGASHGTSGGVSIGSIPGPFDNSQFQSGVGLPGIGDLSIRSQVDTHQNEVGSHLDNLSGGVDHSQGSISGFSTGPTRDETYFNPQHSLSPGRETFPSSGHVGGDTFHKFEDRPAFVSSSHRESDHAPGQTFDHGVHINQGNLQIPGRKQVSGSFNQEGLSHGTGLRFGSTSHQSEGSLHTHGSDQTSNVIGHAGGSNQRFGSGSHVEDDSSHKYYAGQAPSTGDISSASFQESGQTLGFISGHSDKYGSGQTSLGDGHSDTSRSHVSGTRFDSSGQGGTSQHYKSQQASAFDGLSDSGRFSETGHTQDDYSDTTNFHGSRVFDSGNQKDSGISHQYKTQPSSAFSGQSGGIGSAGTRHDGHSRIGNFHGSGATFDSDGQRGASTSQQYKSQQTSAFGDHFGSGSVSGTGHGDYSDTKNSDRDATFNFGDQKHTGGSQKYKSQQTSASSDHFGTGSSFGTGHSSDVNAYESNVIHNDNIDQHANSDGRGGIVPRVKGTSNCC